MHHFSLPPLVILKRKAFFLLCVRKVATKGIALAVGKRLLEAQKHEQTGRTNW